MIAMQHSELGQLNKEIHKLRKEKRRLSQVKAAKLELLKTKVESIPSKFGASHPVIAFLAKHGYEAGKATAKGFSKGTTKAAKMAGGALYKGAKEVAAYNVYSRRSGRGWSSYFMEKKRKRMRA